MNSHIDGDNYCCPPGNQPAPGPGASSAGRILAVEHPRPMTGPERAAHEIEELRSDLVQALATIQEQNRRLASLRRRRCDELLIELDRQAGQPISEKYKASQCEAYCLAGPPSPASSLTGLADSVREWRCSPQAVPV